MDSLSIYNQYTVNDEKVLVYNTKYDNAVEFESDSLEEVIEFLKNETSSELKDLGFCCHYNEIEEEQRRFFELKYSKEILHIMLIMTYDCNCKCSYCFENLDNLCHETTEDCQKVVEYIIKYYTEGNYKELELFFFGGEPTLKVDNMIYIINKFKEGGINLKSSVITNGVLLDKNRVNNLIKNDISTFQITLDGPKEIHDMRRPTKDGISAWDSILDNLIYLGETNATVTIRINVDNENVDYIEETCNLLPVELLNNSNTCIYLAPIVGCKLNNDMQLTLKDRVKYMKRAWKIIREKKLPIIISPPVYAPCPYNSFESAFYIDMSGNIYTCGGFVGKKEKIERIFDDRKLNFWDRINDNPKDYCYSCSFFPVCMGGCKFEAEALGGECQRVYLKEMYDEYYAKYQNK